MGRKKKIQVRILPEDDGCNFISPAAEDDERIEEKHEDLVQKFRHIWLGECRASAHLIMSLIIDIRNHPKEVIEETLEYIKQTNNVNNEYYPQVSDLVSIMERIINQKSSESESDK